ncbi:MULTISPECIES: helix-turn-helix domain-containing protein [Bartonella]|uniref:Helix-turn-helix protein n=1 Tax=Bartonella choladocola TaxID=2750995 RepID=A0A1U9MF21_9HYPH|nr:MULTISPECIES: helix-turn-helix transcriptional regulator [Bartonella]AQT46282.1 helix-turn-helix protein [Bartonella choladocola]MBH9974713.1 helix-turn-helix transcriptional regulator [Bartonella choladocola]MBI0014319.1 helix-turn-helix transcriptional regulator [Bartonella sp. B10834G3]MBI0139650.1 helix-turn-helix transcriptional regulator [Bartonella choladocola]
MMNHMENGGNISSEDVQTLKRNETRSDQKIGGILRHFRKKNGVTQMELAAVAGITPQQIQKYEKGSDRIAVSRLMTLLDFLDINYEEFIKEMRNCN